MFISREELIEEIESHIRKSGGRFGEWSIGTAKDCRGPFFRRHLVADLGDELSGKKRCQVPFSLIGAKKC